MPDQYRHLKRGTTYALVDEAEVHTTIPLTDMELVQIYRSDETGRLYVRRKSEFFDGRFEKIN